MRKEKIAASLELAFSQYGFAEPSVAQLKVACNTTLRTLYKYYPSKEAMVVAALESRHRRYLAFLLNGVPSNGNESILHIFRKLEKWIEEYAPNGCLSLNAIAAFPENKLITEAVKRHKDEVCQLLAVQSQREDLSVDLFLLHEGVSSSWPVIGSSAITAANNILLKLLEVD